MKGVWAVISDGGWTAPPSWSVASLMSHWHHDGVAQWPCFIKCMWGCSFFNPRCHLYARQTNADKFWFDRVHRNQFKLVFVFLFTLTYYNNFCSRQIPHSAIFILSCPFSHLAGYHSISFLDCSALNGIMVLSTVVSTSFVGIDSFDKTRFRFIA